MGVVIALFILIFKRMMFSHGIASPLMGWLIGLSYFLILPLCLLIANGGYHVPFSYNVQGRWGDVDLSDFNYFIPFLIIWLSLMLTACFLIILMPPINSCTRSAYFCLKLSIGKLRNIILTCSAIIIVNWVVTIILMGGIQNYMLLHWYTRFETSIEQWGYFFILFQHITGALQIILTSATALLINTSSKKLISKYAFFIFALSMVLLNMIMTGNRIYIALMMLYICSSLLLQRKFKAVSIFIIILPVFVIFFSTWSHVRGGMDDLSTSISNYQASKKYEDNKIMNALINVTEGSNVMMLLHIMRDFGTRYDLLYGATYSRAVTFPIPRSIYPNRQQNFTTILAELYEPGVTVSYNSTALGEMYANFGYFTVLLLPFFSIVILLLSNCIMAHINRRILLSTVIFMLLAWISRSIFAGNFIKFILCMIIIWGLRFEKGLFNPAIYSQLSNTSLCRIRKILRSNSSTFPA